jgi:hypothetical protein
MQDGATVHTANYSINFLIGVFEDRLVSPRFWHDFYLWVKLKD